jgi:hypothetical protein
VEGFMDVMDIIKALLSSSVIAAMVAGLFQLKRVKHENKENRELLDRLTFVFRHILSEHEKHFLLAINGDRAHDPTCNHPDSDGRHLRRLIDLGFAAKLSENWKVAGLKCGDKVTDYLRITDYGRQYLQLFPT